MIWVPRADIVRSLLAIEEKPARDAVLVAARVQILDDVDAILGESHHPKLGAPIPAARQAVAAERTRYAPRGRRFAARLSATSLPSTTGRRTSPTPRRHLQQQSLTLGSVRFWRRALVQSALLAAIAQTWVELPPGGFNRHLTAHGVDGAQFTPAHPLEALLLVGAILRMSWSRIDRAGRVRENA